MNNILYQFVKATIDNTPVTDDEIFFKQEGKDWEYKNTTSGNDLRNRILVYPESKYFILLEVEYPSTDSALLKEAEELVYNIIEQWGNAAGPGLKGFAKMVTNFAYKASENKNNPEPKDQQVSEEETKTQFGTSAEADFESNTWTFVMPEDYLVVAGEFAIVPKSEYDQLIRARKMSQSDAVKVASEATKETDLIIESEAADLWSRDNRLWGEGLLAMVTFAKQLVRNEEYLSSLNKNK